MQAYRQDAIAFLRQPDMAVDLGEDLGREELPNGESMLALLRQGLRVVDGD